MKFKLVKAFKTLSVEKNPKQKKKTHPKKTPQAKNLISYATIRIFFVGNVILLGLTADYPYLKFPLFLLLRQFPPHWWRRPRIGHEDSYREFRKSFFLQNIGMTFSLWINNIKHLWIMQMQTSSSLKNWEGIQVNCPVFDVDTGLWKEYKCCTRKLDSGYVTCSICKLELCYEESRNCAFGSCIGFWSKQFPLY